MVCVPLATRFFPTDPTWRYKLCTWRAAGALSKLPDLRAPAHKSASPSSQTDGNADENGDFVRPPGEPWGHERGDPDHRDVVRLTKSDGPRSDGLGHFGD